MRTRILIILFPVLSGGFVLATELEQLKEAAAQGNPVAQEELGRKLMFADGAPRDAEKGKEWFRKAYEGFRAAAEKGSADGQFRVGEMYASGRGVTKDERIAFEWWRKAAEQGHGRAQLYVSFHYRDGDVVSKNEAKAIEWLQKSAEGGYDVAQVALGRMYSKGERVPKDGAKAIEWFRKAALQGDLDMQMLISVSYATGFGVPKDEIEGLAWLNIAAAAENQGRVGAFSSQAYRVENRDLHERILGRKATLLAQQRSREILKEMSAAKQTKDSSSNKDAAGSATDKVHSSK